MEAVEAAHLLLAAMAFLEHEVVMVALEQPQASLELA
jgi:hypothetical protein